MSLLILAAGQTERTDGLREVHVTEKQSLIWQQPCAKT